MKKKLPLVLLIVQLALATVATAQNIAINGTGNLPDTSAMLDISSTNKGFLAPRMTTAQQNAIPLPAKGLLLFNTTDNIFRVNTGTPLAPVWTSLSTGTGATTNILTSSVNTLTNTTNGVAATAPVINSNTLTLTGTNLVSAVNGIASASTDLSTLTNDRWKLTGNTGTTPGTNFLGTLDNTDFIFKTNNVEALRLTGTRRLLGLNVTNPIYRIQVEDPGGPDADIATRMYNTSNLGYFPSMQLQVAAGTKAAPLPVVNNTILGGLHFAGYDGSAFNDVLATGIIVKTTQNWNTTSHGSYMAFKTIANNTVAEAERIRIDQNGFFGIGTASPTELLHVNGKARIATLSAGAAADEVVTASATGVLNKLPLATLLNGAAVLSLNGLTGSSQTFAVGTAGNDVGFASSGSTHTFNFPTASASRRGVLSAADWTTFNNKQAAISGTNNRVTVASNTVDISNAYTGQTSLTTLGTIGTGTWNATAIGATYGGTGQTAVVRGDLLFGSAANTWSRLPVGTNGHILTLAGGVPTWAAAPVAAGSGWNTNGNTVTDGVHFLGSTNNVALRIKTNNTERMVIDNAGNVGIGTTTPTSSLQVNGSLATGVLNVTATTTLTEAHSLVMVSNGNTGISIHLPPAADCVGRVYSIKKISSGSGTVTIDGNGAENIDNSGTYTTINTRWEAVTIQSDGNQWYILSRL